MNPAVDEHSFLLLHFSRPPDFNVQCAGDFRCCVFCRGQYIVVWLCIAVRFSISHFTPWPTVPAVR